MKIGITGHTNGIGKSLYDHFKNNHTVLGFSRTNGYDIDTDSKKIIEEIDDCDLFINNTNCNQEFLLIEANKKVPKIITMGSVVTNYPNAFANSSKHNLENLHNRLVSDVDSSKLLLLKLSFIENSEKIDRIDSDFTISHNEIIKSIDFWLDHNYINKIEFHFKLTDYTIRSLEKFNIDIDKIRNP